MDQANRKVLYERERSREKMIRRNIIKDNANLSDEDINNETANTINSVSK
jgi:hypothetical protein